MRESVVVLKSGVTIAIGSEPDVEFRNAEKQLICVIEKKGSADKAGAQTRLAIWQKERWVARASRVLVSASRGNELFSRDTGRRQVREGETPFASTRDARATQAQPFIRWLPYEFPIQDTRRNEKILQQSQATKPSVSYDLSPQRNHLVRKETARDGARR